MERIHGNYRLLILPLLFLTSGFVCGEDDAMESSKEIVAKQFQKWQNGKTSFFHLLAEDVVWEVSGTSPVSGLYRGKSQFMERAVNPIMRKLSGPLKPELISLSTDDSNVWLHFKGSAMTKTGGLYENTYAWKMELKIGKIIKGTAFLDTYALTQLMKKQEKGTN